MHTCNSATTCMTLSTGPSTNITTTPAAAPEGWVLNSIDHARDLSLAILSTPTDRELPVKHPVMKVENKSIALELQGPSAQGHLLNSWTLVNLFNWKSWFPLVIAGEAVLTSQTGFFFLMPCAFFWSREKYYKFQQWRTYEAKNDVIKQNKIWSAKDRA